MALEGITNFSGDGGWTRFEHPEGLFSISYPSRWRQVPAVSDGAALSCRADDGSVLFEVVCLAMAREPAYGERGLVKIAVDGIVKYSAHEAGMSGGRVIAQNSFPFGGAEACTDVLLAYRDQTGTEISAHYFVVGTGRHALYVALKTPTAIFVSNQRDFERALGTLMTPWILVSEVPDLSVTYQRRFTDIFPPVAYLTAFSDVHWFGPGIDPPKTDWKFWGPSSKNVPMPGTKRWVMVDSVRMDCAVGDLSTGQEFWLLFVPGLDGINDSVVDHWRNNPRTINDSAFVRCSLLETADAGQAQAQVKVRINAVQGFDDLPCSEIVRRIEIFDLQRSQAGVRSLFQSSSWDLISEQGEFHTRWLLGRRQSNGVLVVVSAERVFVAEPTESTVWASNVLLSFCAFACLAARYPSKGR
jgi:hypothetical protein